MEWRPKSAAPAPKSPILLGFAATKAQPRCWSNWREMCRLARASDGVLPTAGNDAVHESSPPDPLVCAWPAAVGTAGQLMIGRGRIYVHGLLAENHGGEPWEFDRILAEERGTVPVPYT